LFWTRCGRHDFGFAGDNVASNSRKEQALPGLQWRTLWAAKLHNTELCHSGFVHLHIVCRRKPSVANVIYTPIGLRAGTIGTKGAEFAVDVGCLRRQGAKGFDCVGIRVH
jgi:hypothetical protein